MQVVTIICESFHRQDLEQAAIPAAFDGFRRFEMDLAPVYDSVSALTMLQSGRCRAWERRKRTDPIFHATDDLLAFRHRTRLISSCWPSYCNARLLDPKANHAKNRRRVKVQEEAERYLREEFYAQDYRHLIFWGRRGHVGQRVGLENFGIPTRLTNTMNRWLSYLGDEILPLIQLDTTAVLLHPDHGSARRGLTREEALHQGFLWVRSPISVEPCDAYDWSSMRVLLVHLLESPCPTPSTL